MPVRLPPSVGPEGRIYVTHAAGRVAEDALEAGEQVLRARGFDVRRDATLGRFRSTDGPRPAAFSPLHGASNDYLAGPDVLRARDITHALTAPDVDVVMAARGGYGAMRIVERLPWGLLADQPRWIVGYSDITTLHLWAYAQGVASIHGPMCSGLAKHGADGSLDGLVAALAGHPAPIPASEAAWPDRMRGPLVGGNLSLLAALRPTRFFPKLDGVILFIEEVSEPLYRIDRALQTLALAGGLDRVAGFAIGQLTRCGGPTSEADETDAELRALDVVVERLARYRKPILVGLPVGHGSPNASFIHGAEYTWDDGALQCTARRDAPPMPTTRARRRPQTANHPLAEAVAAGVCSGAQLHVSQGAEVTHDTSVGVTAITGDAVQSPVTAHTLFDVASVTKAVATAVLAHKAIAAGMVSLDAECPAEFSVSTPTLRDLLRHTSGLPAYEPVWSMARRARDSRAFAERRFAGIAVDPNRVGDGVYSDVGFIALGRWLERLFDASLASLFDAHIVTPLGLGSAAGFGVATDDLGAVAATELCDFRKGTLQGVVQDRNCQVLGGAAGHAGVFATAGAIGAIARSLLGHGPAILPPEAVERMWDPAQRVGSFTLGWDTPSGPRSNAGNLMDREHTVGHLGFSGTSVWIDRVRELVIVLHTNRVHPHRENAGIRWLRPAIHDAVMRELGYAPST